MREFTCNYSLIFPTILCDLIMAQVSVAFSYWYDLDDDKFTICIDCIFEGEQLYEDEWKAIEAIITPYLWKE